MKSRDFEEPEGTGTSPSRKRILVVKRTRLIGPWQSEPRSLKSFTSLGSEQSNRRGIKINAIYLELDIVFRIIYIYIFRLDGMLPASK